MGDHVKVIAGRYEGDTGLIVRIENNIAIIFSDLTLHEVCVCVCVCVHVCLSTCLLYAGTYLAFKKYAVYKALNLLSFCS